MPVPRSLDALAPGDIPEAEVLAGLRTLDEVENRSTGDHDPVKLVQHGVPVRYEIEQRRHDAKVESVIVHRQ